MSGETATRGVEGVGLFEDQHRSAICGAQCMHVCAFMGLFEDEQMCGAQCMCVCVFMGLFEDEQMCGAQCMSVCVFVICCEILWNFESH